MNYYAPRQRQSDGRYDYTVRNDHHTYAVGYCAGWPSDEELTQASAQVGEVYDAEMARLGPFRDRFHRDGHVTEGEACACYRRYTLDQRLRFGELADQQRHCAECGSWTQGYASVGSSTLIFLCGNHQTREIVEKHFEGTTTMMSSE